MTFASKPASPHSTTSSSIPSQSRHVLSLPPRSAQASISHVVDRSRRRIANQTILRGRRPELLLLCNGGRILAPLLHLGEVELLLRQQVVHAPRILWRDVVDLCEIAGLDLREADELQEVRCVLVQMLSRRGSHDASVQLPSLIILGWFPFVPVVGFPRDDVITDLVRCLGGIGSELVDEAVWYVLWISGVVGIDAQLSVKVEAGVRRGHKGTIDWAECQAYADRHDPVTRDVPGI